MQECEHKFDKNNNFSKNTNILQEVGTNSRIHTFRMQAYAENCEKNNTCAKSNSSWCPMLQSHLVLPACLDISFSLEAVSKVLL